MNWSVPEINSRDRIQISVVRGPLIGGKHFDIGQSSYSIDNKNPAGKTENHNSSLELRHQIGAAGQDGALGMNSGSRDNLLRVPAFGGPRR